MGPENEAGLNSFTLCIGDVPVADGKIELILDEMTGGTEPEVVMLMLCAGFTLKIRDPKRWRCRSRKRFVKLIMSEGIDRNGAEWVAGFVRGWMPYGEAWVLHLLRGLRGSDDLRWVKQMKAERMKRNAGNETAHGSGGGEGAQAPVQD